MTTLEQQPARALDPEGSVDALVEGTVPIALTIVAVILLDAGFSFAQEQRAERATEALRAFLPPRVRVRRGAS
jgi:hypothetical protein